MRRNFKKYILLFSLVYFFSSSSQAQVQAIKEPRHKKVIENKGKHPSANSSIALTATGMSYLNKKK